MAIPCLLTDPSETLSGSRYRLANSEIWHGQRSPQQGREKANAVIEGVFAPRPEVQQVDGISWAVEPHWTGWSRAALNGLHFHGLDPSGPELSAVAMAGKPTARLQPRYLPYRWLDRYNRLIKPSREGGALIRMAHCPVKADEAFDRDGSEIAARACARLPKYMPSKQTSAVSCPASASWPARLALHHWLPPSVTGSGRRAGKSPPNPGGAKS